MLVWVMRAQYNFSFYDNPLKHTNAGLDQSSRECRFRDLVFTTTPEGQLSLAIECVKLMN